MQRSLDLQQYLSDPALIPQASAEAEGTLRALRRHLRCPWCWKALRLMRLYPRRWSSTICAHHERQIRARATARRLARERAAAATKAAIAVLQVAEEVQV